MIKPEWGTKRTCPKCATRFYDLTKDDPVSCINCGYAWAPEAILKSKQPMAFEAVKADPAKNDADLGADEDLDIVADEGEPSDDDEVDPGGDDELRRTREAQDAHGGSMAPGLVDATGNPVADPPSAGGDVADGPSAD